MLYKQYLKYCKLKKKKKMERRAENAARGISCYPEKLSILAIMKNEAMNLDEWIRHYLWQGISHIYLIDNGSDDESLDIARQWSKKGPVTVVSYPEQWKQRPHYWRAIKELRIRERSEWLIISDLDEFWFAKEHATLPDAICNFHDLELIYCNWTIFGTGGHIDHPQSIRRDLLSTPKTNPLEHRYDCRKFMVRTECLHDILNLSIHYVVGVDSSAVATENRLLQLNHYMIQSREYFSKVKMTRGDANSEAGGSIRDWDYFDSIESLCTGEDHTLSRKVLECAQEQPRRSAFDRTDLGRL